jgi:hypothetical protein
MRSINEKPKKIFEILKKGAVVVTAPISKDTPYTFTPKNARGKVAQSCLKKY